MWVVMVTGGGFFWLKKERPIMVGGGEMLTNMWLEIESNR